jgi:hypothetical protein
MSIGVREKPARKTASKKLRERLPRGLKFRRTQAAERYQQVRPDCDIVQSANKDEAVKIHRDWASPVHADRASLIEWRSEIFPQLEAKVLARKLALAFEFWNSEASIDSILAQEVFPGRVDNIQDGIAYVTLFPDDGDVLVAQWPEKDLVKESIGKSDLFELTMTDSGVSVSHSFRKTQRKAISDDLRQEVERIRAYYADLLTKDGNGEEAC